MAGGLCARPDITRPLSTLNADVLNRVFELSGPLVPCCYSGLFGRDYGTLLACSLVCRMWAGEAQRVLFRHVTFAQCKNGSKASFRKFLATLALLTVRGSILPNVVQTLVVYVGHQARTLCNWGGVVEHAIAHPSLANVAWGISMCVNLRNLQFTHIGDPTRGAFNQNELSLLGRATSVKSLRLHVHDHCSTILSQFLNLWPNVSSLHAIDIPAVDSQCEPLPRCSIREFEASARLSNDFLSLLGQFNSNELESLILGDVDDFERCVQPFKSALKSLVIRHMSTSPRASRIQCLAELTSLETLILECEHSSELFEFVPSSVRHLGFYPAKGTTPCQDLVQFLSSHPQLQTITLVYHDRLEIEANDRYLSFLNLAKSRNIGLHAVHWKIFKQQLRSYFA